MPSYPSDNLYSGDDDAAVSDSESFSEELSPTDGYFQRPEMSGNTQQLVPDPTIDYGRPEDKTLIEPPDSQSGGSRVHPSSPPVHSPISLSQNVSAGTSPRQPPSMPVSPVSTRWRHSSFSEQEPLMYQPPPAYSESPPPSHRSPNSIGPSYNTFAPAPGLPIHPREPQSMGGPVDQPPSEVTPLIAWKRKCMPRRKRIQALLFAGVVLTVIVTTLGIIFGCATDTTSSPIEGTDYCPQATTKKEQVAYEFVGGKELSIIHKNGNETLPSFGQVHGEIRLRRTPSTSQHGNRPYITVDISNTVDFDATVKWSEDSQKLELFTFQTNTRNRRNQCLAAIITAVIPEGTQITNFVVESPTLNLALSDLKINVTGRAQFSTLSGSVWLTPGLPIEPEASFSLTHPATSSKPAGKTNTSEVVTSFHSRRTIIETHSGSISGIYPLYDELVLSSGSGSIDVGVTPKAALKSDPKPADLEVQTASGSIEVHLPLDNFDNMIPLRNYITRVHTTSGSIFGHYYLGSESSFKTTSGSIEIRALPVLPEDLELVRTPPNSFETHTLSGSTKVSALTPFSFVQNTTDLDLALQAAIKLRSLRSSHSSNSGELNIMHTDAWEGSVHAKSVSGDLQVRGNGFRTIKERNGFGYKELLKRRGVDGKGEGSEVEASTVSGSIQFNIVI